MKTLVELQAEAGFLHENLAGIVHVLEAAAGIIDLFAIAILLIGAARFVIGFAGAEIAGDAASRARRIMHQRCLLGRYILAGLELFIVSDVIHTALSLKFSDLLFLLLLVVIRSITSYFLDRELEALKKELRDG